MLTGSHLKSLWCRVFSHLAAVNLPEKRLSNGKAVNLDLSFSAVSFSLSVRRPLLSLSLSPFFSIHHLRWNERFSIGSPSVTFSPSQFKNPPPSPPPFNLGPHPSPCPVRGGVGATCVRGSIDSHPPHHGSVSLSKRRNPSPCDEGTSSMEAALITQDIQWHPYAVDFTIFHHRFSSRSNGALL